MSTTTQYRLINNGEKRHYVIIVITKTVKSIYLCTLLLYCNNVSRLQIATRKLARGRHGPCVYKTVKLIINWNSRHLKAEDLQQEIHNRRGSHIVCAAPTRGWGGSGVIYLMSGIFISALHTNYKTKNTKIIFWNF